MAVFAISATEPSRAIFTDWRSFMSFTVVVIVSPAIGFFLGILFGSLLLPPMYVLRERLNGGPFKVGDSVQILVGPHKGMITKVVRPWQGRSYRVKLDKESEKSFKDVFCADQLIKEMNAEQAVPGYPPHGVGSPEP